MDATNPYQTYERDTRWSAVDAYALQHLDQNNTCTSALQYAQDLAQQHNLPAIEVSAMQGKFLAVQAQLLQAKHVLEVGTLGGYSAIWIASSDPATHVTSIEVDARHKDVAEKALAHAGLAERVEVLLGKGVDVLPQLREEVEKGQRERFDMVFIDADKPGNAVYFDHAVAMCRSRACVIVDNVVRKGDLAREDVARVDAKVRGSREVVEMAGRDPRVLGSTLMQTVGEKNYDGFLICVVK